jgi:hypothetical protein
LQVLAQLAHLGTRLGIFGPHLLNQQAQLQNLFLQIVNRTGRITRWWGGITLRPRSKVEQADSGEGYGGPAKGKISMALHNVLLHDPERGTRASEESRAYALG